MKNYLKEQKNIKRNYKPNERIKNDNNRSIKVTDNM